MTSRASRLGIALLALYAVVAAATAAWAPGRVRPLFDGFGTHPGEYNWVKPPKEFAEGNRPPDSSQARISLGGAGSSPVLAETPDGQVMVSLPQGAVPPHGSDAAATLEVRPFDATELGQLPAGLRPEGNAYKVTIAYLPSGTELPAVVVPGRVGVTAEVRPTALLFAPDGRSWRPIQAEALGPANGFTAELTETGYYLAAGPGEPRPAASSEGAPVALFVVAAAVPLLLGYLLLRRRPPPVTPGSRLPLPRPGAKPDSQSTARSTRKKKARKRR